MKAGIDLGTTYSLIARMDAEGRPALFPDQRDSEAFHTPSVVHVTPGAAFVGSLAENLLEHDPDLTILRYFKRDFGGAAPVHVDEEDREWRAEGVAALLIRKLCFDAESFTSVPVEQVVISVPAQFSDPQRRAVMASAALAGVRVMGLVDEPVAAALHYGIAAGGAKGQTILVYDFGGGTFDATLLTMAEDRITVLAKDGTELGGKEIDDRVGEILLRQFGQALGEALPVGARTRVELRRVAEQFKIELCTPGRRRVRRLAMLGGHVVEVDLHRDEFERSITELVERTERVTLRCLAAAGTRPDQVDRLLLVGGSSLVPLVEERMRKLFAHLGDGVAYHEPTRAVAYGAAIRASQLAGDADAFVIPPELKGVTGFNVGVRTIDSVTGRVSVDTIVKRNMALPVQVRKTFFSSRKGQRRIILDFVQYDDDHASLINLGQLLVGPLPSDQVNYPVEVTVECREDGTVNVGAYDVHTGTELEQAFSPRGGEEVRRFASQYALVRSSVINGVIS